MKKRKEREAKQGKKVKDERIYLKKKRSRQVFVLREGSSNRRVVVKRYANPQEAASEYAVMKAYGEQRSLVRLLDFVVLNEQANLVMEWLDGMTVEEMVQRRGPLCPEKVIEIGLEILAGVKVLHDLGYVHGDLHGGNVMVLDRTLFAKKSRKKEKKKVKDPFPDEVATTETPVGTPLVKIVDFQHSVQKDAKGIAAALRILQEPPDHLAPESSTGRIDDSYDLYGVGYVCAMMLVGKAPTRTDLLAKVYGDDPLWNVIWKAVQKDPKRRYRSAGTMAADLRKLQTGIAKQLQNVS